MPRSALLRLAAGAAEHLLPSTTYQAQVVSTAASAAYHSLASSCSCPNATCSCTSISARISSHQHASASFHRGFFTSSWQSEASSSTPSASASSTAADATQDSQPPAAQSPQTQQQLKVKLRPDEEAAKKEVLDYYELSRSMFAEGDVVAQLGVRVDADGAKLLNKLVGCLTKDGKRSKAHKIVVDAMIIINEKLAKQRLALQQQQQGQQ